MVYYPSYDRRKQDLPIRTRIFNHVTAMIVKMTEIMMSLKVQVIVGITAVSTWLVVNSYIDGGNWTTIMCCLITTTLSIREAYKISRIISENNIKKVPDIIKEKISEEIKKQSGSINKDKILNE